MVKRNIALINAYTVCTNMVFVLPVVVVFYKSIGLGFKEFLIAEAVFSGVVLLAEMPSGWLSDVWHRRATLMLGLFFAVAGYTWLLMADSLTDAIVSQGIIGIAVAINSGTVTALLYDTLLQEGREGEYRRLEGRRHAISLYSVAAACVIGALAFRLNPYLPLLLDILILVAGMFCVVGLTEPARHKKPPQHNPFRDMAETAHYALRGHPEIAGVIMISMVIFCATKLMMWAQQPYYQLLDIPVAWFGVIMAGSYCLGGVAGQFSHRIEHWGSNRAKLGWMAAILGTACIVLWLLPTIFLAIPLFLLGTLAWGMGNPVVQNAINNRIGSERRATVLSTANLMVHVLTIPTSLILAWIEGAFSVRESIGYLGLQIFVVAGIGLWLWKPLKDPVPA